MIHILDPGIADSTFPILDVVPAEDFPLASHTFSLRVVGWSMFPTILKGDRLVMAPPDQVQPGDIVVFPFMDTLVCHRVIGIENGIVHTQGDSVDTQDRPVRMQEILGKVATILRGPNRFTPTSTPRSPRAVLAWKKVDEFWVRLREQLTTWTLTALVFLKRRTPVRMLAVFVLTRYVRFYLGVRAPVQSVQAYRFMPLPKVAHGGILVGPLPTDFHATSDVLIQARLGRHRLGTFRPASNTMHVRRAAAGLGLEEYFHSLNQMMQLPQPADIR
jgi:signal peptidase I